LLKRDLLEYYHPNLVHLIKKVGKSQEKNRNFLKKRERNKLRKLKKTEIKQPEMWHSARKMYG
jgi:hypothetical protein